MGQWSMLTGFVPSGSVYCVAQAGENCRNVAIWPNFHILRDLVSISFYQFGPNLAANMGVLFAAGLRLCAPNFIWIRLLCHVPGTKPQSLANFDICLGLLYPAPFTDKGQIWCAKADPRYTLTCQMSSRSIYSVALWRRKKNKFCKTSAFCCVASWRQSQKVERGCTTTNLPVFNRFYTPTAL